MGFLKKSKKQEEKSSKDIDAEIKKLQKLKEEQDKIEQEKKKKEETKKQMDESEEIEEFLTEDAVDEFDSLDDFVTSLVNKSGIDAVITMIDQIKNKLIKQSIFNDLQVSLKDDEPEDEEITELSD